MRLRSGQRLGEMARERRVVGAVPLELRDSGQVPRGTARTQRSPRCEWARAIVKTSREDSRAVAVVASFNNRFEFALVGGASPGMC